MFGHTDEKPIYPRTLGVSRVPRHVAVIMDGNGRWATAQGKPRLFGHKEGAKAVRRAVTFAYRVGIKHLTLYAFSSQNWSRPPSEVAGLMALFLRYVKGERELILKRQIRFRVIGDRSKLPKNVVRAIEGLEGDTQHFDRMDLSIALSYGGREEILNAAKALAMEVADGKRDPNSIDEDSFSNALYTRDLPDPDLLIRTSGEFRISNFLLWQLAYAELYVTPVLWPDFGEATFVEALRDYSSRERRFGKTSDQLINQAGASDTSQGRLS